MVDETITINPVLLKELRYSWQYGFIEDTPQEAERSGSPNLLRKDDHKKSGKALRNPLKGKVQSETPHTVKTAVDAVFGKSDIAKQKLTQASRKKKIQRRKRK